MAASLKSALYTFSDSHRLRRVSRSCRSAVAMAGIKAPACCKEREQLAEPWEFLRSLPDSLIRDLGFVILGPPLLLDSDEFPTVRSNVLGGCRDDWQQTAEWLKKLDADFVRSWFESKRSTTRLGDHFAKCVEFVLRFSPAIELEVLFFSQQVLEPVKLESNFESELADLEQAENDGDNKYEKRRARRLLRKLHKQVGKSVVNTIGEFDFLFKPKKNGACEAESDVEHWEVSVKYLLYVGPWEAFGLVTPRDAKWRNLGTCSSEEFQQQQQDMISDITKDEFLGCFLGPHVGETLADRRQRLKNQLALPSRGPASEMLLRSLFQSSCCCDNPIEESQKNVQVSSRALLQGYLFYEPGLWEHVKTTHASSPWQAASSLNSMHWKGWWLSVEKFSAFASLPEHRSSHWYVAPKQEWLSPVVIHQADEQDRFSNVLNLEGLMAMAAKLADEAAKLEFPRMARFLVAEMQPSYGESVWVEISRGFIVEETWPDSKIYGRYGFDTTWKPVTSKDLGSS